MNYFIFLYILFFAELILGDFMNPVSFLSDKSHSNKSSNLKKKNDIIKENNQIVNDMNRTIIKLNTSNSISLKGVINNKNTNRFLYDFSINENKNNLYLFIDSVGGSVEDGYKIISEIKKYNVTCVVEKAYSMAFAILQSCNKRYLLPYGKLMQHQISLGIMNELAKIESYLVFINQMENELLKIQSDKIGISSDDLKNKTYNEWWLFGDNAINENCADEIVQVECTKELTKKTYTINDGMYDFVYSRCPLVPDYLDKVKNNKNSQDFIYFV